MRDRLTILDMNLLAIFLTEFNERVHVQRNLLFVFQTPVLCPMLDRHRYIYRVYLESSMTKADQVIIVVSFFW